MWDIKGEFDDLDKIPEGAEYYLNHVGYKEYKKKLLVMCVTSII